MKIIRRIICLIVRHKWDSVHGYYNEPNDGAICTRCMAQFVYGRGVVW